jgi:prevent-host-death family protein
MKFATRIKPISYLKSHAAEIAKEVAASGEPMLITQNGEARFVVMDIDDYERKEETLALLKMLALGQRDIEQGRFRDADAVLDAMDADETT